MDRSSQITLIAETYTADSIGQLVATETSTTVYCNIASVTRMEWSQAGQLGLKPEYKVTMFAPEYNGEKICTLNGTRYSIYRTYLAKGEMLELYLEKKGGT